MLLSLLLSLLLLSLLVGRTVVVAMVVDGGESLEGTNHILEGLECLGGAVLVVFLAKVSELLLHGFRANVATLGVVS